MMRRTPLIWIFATLFVTIIATADEFSDESRAIAKVELLGGIVERDETQPHRPVVSVSIIESNRFTDKHLQLLCAFESLRTVHLYDIRLFEVGLFKLADLDNLTTLSLCGDEFTDDRLSEIRQMKGLKTLNLSGTKITGEGLASLIGIQTLEDSKSPFSAGANVQRII